jgi:hypothetical protein
MSVPYRLRSDLSPEELTKMAVYGSSWPRIFNHAVRYEIVHKLTADGHSTEIEPHVDKRREDTP